MEIKGKPCSPGKMFSGGAQLTWVKKEMVNCAAATQGKEEEGEGVWRKNKARKSSKSKWCVDIKTQTFVAVKFTWGSATAHSSIWLVVSDVLWWGLGPIQKDSTTAQL